MYCRQLVTANMHCKPAASLNVLLMCQCDTSRAVLSRVQAYAQALTRSSRPAFLDDLEVSYQLSIPAVCTLERLQGCAGPVVTTILCTAVNHSLTFAHRD